MTDEDEYDPFRSFQTRNAVLRRGGYATLLTLAGGGMSSWEGLALTRWSADRTRDAEGLFIWLDNWRGSDELSAGAQPMREGIHGYDPALPAFNRTGKEIHVHVQVRLAPEGDAELRRVRVNNFHHDDRRVYATTYAELALNTPTGDAAHPAFSKLFVQTEWDAEREALLASRRLRSPDDAPLWAVHAVRVPENEYRVRPVQYETDRSRFVGRGHSLADPRAVLPTGQLSSTVGNVLDPVFSIRQQIDVPAEDVTEFVVILGAGRTREQARAIADRYATLELALAAFEAAGEADEVWLDDDGGEEERAAAVAVPASWMRNAHGLGALSLMGMPPEEEEGAENWYDRVPDLYQEAWLPTRDDPAPFPEALHFFNGFGGFSQDGREYVIRLPGWRYPPVRPPLPWTNVIANEEAGFLVSESGAASTWAANSRENRLTPWSNDPVSDPHGEALHLRDEEGEKRFWSPTPGPNPGYGWYEVRHGFGYTRFLHTSLELRQETTMFVPRRGPVKVVRLRVTNEGHQTRRLSAFSYAHLVLGGLPQETVENVVTRWDDAAGAIFATNRRR
ncbi:MAG TPA: hypothetical protein VFZ20_24965, partial [Longimicrobium sp.]|nr:hypothetical protein [Longimicrobium sp.]